MDDPKQVPRVDAESHKEGQHPPEERAPQIKPDKDVVVPKYVLLTEGYDPAKLKDEET